MSKQTIAAVAALAVLSGGAIPNTHRLRRLKSA